MSANTQPEFPKLLTPRQAAELLNVNVRKVYEMIDTQALPCIVLGPRSYRIKESDLWELVS